MSHIHAAPARKASTTIVRILLLLLALAAGVGVLTAATGTVMPVPRQQFFDSNGDPLTGGKLYTYTAGTSTPLATCADNGITGATCTTPNTNPIILSSAGRPTSNGTTEVGIYLIPGNTYKFILQNSAGVQQWSQDNVSGPGLFTSNMTGDLLFSPDATYDIGKVNATRARDAFFSRNLAIGAISSNTRQVHILGTGQAATPTSVLTDAGATAGTVYIQDSNGGAGSGGTLVFGGSSGFFTAIRGYFADGSGNTTGHLTFLTRATTGATSLLERARIWTLGGFSVGGTPSDPGAGGINWTGALMASDAAIISPTGLTANTDDWNPTGLATASVIRIGSNGGYNLTGIAAQSGHVIQLLNRSAFSITIKSGVTSAAANQFQTAAAADVIIRTGGAVWIYYSASDTKWAVIAP